MKIAYIKLDKPTNENIISKIKYNVKNKMNKVWNDIDNKEIYYMCNAKEKSKKKIIKVLENDKIDYALTEKIDLEYPKLEGRYLLKYMLPEVVEYCFKKIKLRNDEIYICTNKYNNENLTIIYEFINRVKVVNIVSNNENYRKLEEKLEEKGEYIAVLNNKRKTLKNANIVINLDFENLKEYNINRNMIIIDLTNKFQIPTGFNGIYIRKIKIDTNKIMRIFSEFENFNRNELLEAEMIKLEKFEDVREYIRNNRFYITELYGKRKIDISELAKIGRTEKKND